jgi:hypothetical protein
MPLDIFNDTVARQPLDAPARDTICHTYIF